jgi:ATP-binding cassette subfamily C (CFTR/MRP) protein 4
MIYRKTLRLSQATIRSFSVGQLVTMLSSDVHRFDQQDLYLNYLWIAPLHLSITIYMLFVYYDFGWSSLVGLLLIIIFVILQYLVSKYVARVRLDKIVASHRRMKVIIEIMNAFRSIKMYACESPLYKKARNSRLVELVYIKQTMILRILNTSLSLILTKITVFLTLLCYVLDEQHLDAQRIFITIILYEHVRLNFAYLFVQGCTDMAETTVTFTRLTEFLLLQEQYTEPEKYEVVKPPKNGEDFGGFKMDNVCSKWHPDMRILTLDKICLDVRHGEFMAIVGALGSGKSALFSAILGELPVLEGKITMYGAVSYVPQLPWLFPGTVRQNIIFGKSFDQDWYEQVIETCALQTDLDRMSDGDQTKVLHAGLSVGQKARISLARAVYSNSDVYLMDDPLNCIDVRLSRHILDKCIKGVLKDKAVVLITHQIHFLEAANRNIILVDGAIRAEGTYMELLQRGIQFSKEVDDSGDLIEEGTDEIPIRRKSIVTIQEDEFHHLLVMESQPQDPDLLDETGVDISTATSVAVQEAEAEALDIVPVKKELPTTKLYWTYLKSSASGTYLILLVLMSIMLQALYSGSDYWLEHWIEVEEQKQREHKSESEYSFVNRRQIQIVIYFSLIPSLVIVTIARSLVMFKICIHASLTLFCQLTDSLLRATTKFIDTNCAGHGINRFSKDMIIIDELLPESLYDVSGVVFEIIGAVVILGVTNPYFLIPSIIFLILCLWVYRIYHRSATSLKRIESNARSPVYAHITKTLEGIMTIRSYGQEEIFLKIFDDLQDKHTAVWGLYVAAQAWLAVIVDCLSLSLVSAITIGFVYFDDSNAASVGLAIAKAIELTILAQLAVVEVGNMETEMISVERLSDFKYHYN